MHPLRAPESPGTRPAPGPGPVAFRAAGLAIASAGAVALAASGCGSSASSASPGPNSSSSPSSSSAPASAQQAITEAAKTTATLNSTRATVRINTGTQLLTENLQLQLHPKLKMSATLKGLGTGGSIREVIIGTTAYVKIASLPGSAGKKWLKITGTGGKGSALIKELLQEASSGNLNNQARLAQVMDGAHEVGHATVGGVPTTEYAGSIDPAKAMSRLPAKLRQQLAPVLNEIHGKLQVSYWIDGQHLIRKVVEVENVNGQQVHTTIVYRAINQPVHIKPPPPGQVSSLNSATGL